MKKTDFGYVLKWYGALILVIVAVLSAFGVTGHTAVLLGGVLVIVAAMLFVRKTFDKNWQKQIEILEETFPQRQFTYQYKFTSHKAVFYIDQGGRIGIVWKYNPSKFYFADLATLSDIRTHDGKMMRGTELVSCQFNLGGKRYKIYTLRVSGGQLPMNSPEVKEAIAKADHLCQMLQTAQRNAAQQTAAQS